MEQKTINFTECDDLQITSHLNMEALVNRLAMQVKNLHERLNGAGCTMHDARLGGEADRLKGGEVEFRLTPDQASLLGQVMEKEYKEYVRVLGDGFHATVVRNGINVMRIAAVLSALRLVESESESELICTKEDFETAMVIGTKMLLHAADAYNQITEGNKEAVPSIKGSYQKETFFVSLPEEFSKSQCEHYAQRLGVCDRTARRWIEGWLEIGKIERLNHGNYHKVC